MCLTDLLPGLGLGLGLSLQLVAGLVQPHREVLPLATQLADHCPTQPESQGLSGGRVGLPCLEPLLRLPETCLPCCLPATSGPVAPLSYHPPPTGMQAVDLLLLLCRALHHHQQQQCTMACELPSCGALLCCRQAGRQVGRLLLVASWLTLLREEGGGSGGAGSSVCCCCLVLPWR